MHATTSTTAAASAPSFKVNDLVMFARRTQTTAAGMRVEDVDETLFGVRIKVDGRWWSEGCFVPHSAWAQQNPAAASH